MRLIFIIGSTETLEYFSLQLAEYYRQLGRDIFIWDMRHPVKSREAFEALPDKEQSILITFNFIGLCDEGQFGCRMSEKKEGMFVATKESIWDTYGISKYVIMVDSPIYYFRQLSGEISDLHPVCIDGFHQAYVEREYPQYGKVLFLPLAGNLPMETLWRQEGKVFPIAYENRRISERPIDVVFIGNYVPEESLLPSIANMGEDYKEFLLSVASYFTEHPSLPMEDTMLSLLREEIPEGTDEEYREAMFHMIFVDLYVRSVYRGQIVSALADAGVQVYCTGKDWDKAPCGHPENLHHTGDSVTSIECIRALQQAKISLNVMPWFKDGAHDRIFSSMLAGCVCVTDSSLYLDRVLSDGENAVLFPLLSPQESGMQCAEIVIKLLKDPVRMQEIADAGRSLALENHTWSKRGDALLEVIEKGRKKL